MKLPFVLTAALLLSANSAHALSTAAKHRSAGTVQQASTASTQSATSAPKIDPAKEADIRRLLELLGTKDSLMQAFDEMGGSLKPELAKALPPGDYREKLIDLFVAKFTAKENLQQFLDLAIPVYDRNFSHQEIRSLIDFYQTPLGRKTISVLPKLALESQEEGRKWGENLGRKSMEEVLTEHPELADALAAAQQAAVAPKQ